MTPPAGRRIRFVCDTTSFGSGTCNAASLCSVTNVTSAVGVALTPFTCNVPAGNATPGPAVGELATGQSKDIFLRYEVLDQPPASGDVFSAGSSVTSDQLDTFLANNNQVEGTTTRNRIDIRVTKAASLPTVSVGQPFNWVVTVANQGPGHSQITDLTDTLPTGSVITGPITWSRTLQAASGTCSVAGLTVTCNLGRLDSTGVATVTIPVRFDTLPTGGAASNSAIVDVDPGKTGADDFPGGNNTGNATVTVTRSSITGTVFEDRDRAGAPAGTPQLAAADPRIAGVSIRLTGTDSFGGIVDRTTTTDGSGNFAFNDLAPSNVAGYVLTQTQPTGYVNGPADPPTSGGSQPSAGGRYSRGGTSGKSSYSAVVLGANVAAANYNFPELRQVSLSGFVYTDVNTNGVRDAGTDTPITGATVRLLNAGTLGLVASTTTDGTGAYSFTGLDPLIVYTLEEPLPVTAGSLANGPVNPGLIGGAACAAGCTAQANTPIPGTDRIAAIDLSAGADGTLFNFGELQATAISGTVYVDRNTNNTLDPTPTDGRLAGVTLTLYAGSSCSGTVLATQLTDASGSYSFGGLAAGQTYTICQTQPVGYADGGVNAGTNASSPAANALTITGLPLGGSGGNHFAERLGSIAGSVYLDANNDGIRQGGESGIAGVTITLTGTDAAGASVNRTATTDGSGNYLFADVVGSGAGGYALTEQSAQPVVASVTTLNGRTTGGTISAAPAGTATAVSTTPSAISGIVLPAGGASINNLFGEILPVSISGIVFSDANNNGVQNLPGDVGLGSVTITLTGTDDTGAAVSRTLTTAPDGSFSAANLRPGTYNLTQPTQPAGTSNGQTVPGSAGGTATAQSTTPSAITGIVLTTPGTASTDNRFAEIPDSGVIAGRVWTDANNDGVVDASESGIAGQTIQLSGTDSLGNAVTRTVITAADGSWSFSGLAPGNYTVTQPAQPPGTLNGRTVPGTGGGTATPSGSLPSVISGIALAAGQSSLNNNFGEILGAQLAGRVWLDSNNDGLIGAGENGIGVVAIDLTGTNDLGVSVSLSSSTAADGSYSFTGLRPGTYTLTEPVQPTGTFNGRTVAGSAGGSVTAVGTTPSAISGIVLAAGQNGVNNNFGELPAAQISGRVWTDGNNNGVVDSGETGIAGVVLNLTGTDDLGATVSVTVTTAADGTWTFTGLRPGTYTVTEPTQPAGTLNGRTLAGSTGGTPTGVATLPSAITGIVVSAGQVSSNNLFGEISGAQINGRVWTDSNNNGLIDGTETGLVGVTITLSGTNDLGAAVNLSTTTAADGSYSFAGLRPGTYAVLEPTQPAGTLNGRTVAGTAGGTATGLSTLPSGISGIVLIAGQNAAANNFGEILGAQLQGRVWADANNDGVIGAGESGIAGVSLVLTGTDDIGNAVSVTRVTVADGSYSFTDLRPGTYTVTEPTQPPGTSNGLTVAGSAGGTVTPVATTPSAISGALLTAGLTATAYNFGEIPDSADLLVSKTHTKAAFTVGLTGSYQISVRNGGSQPTSGSYTVQDRLPTGLTLSAPPTGAGWTCTGAAGASSFSCSASSVIAAGATGPGVINVVVSVGAAAQPLSPVSNAVLVEGGGEVPARGPSAAERDTFLNNPTALPVCVAGVTHNACRDPVVVQLAAALSGTVWTDTGTAGRLLDAGDRRMPGWLVEVLDIASGNIVGRATSSANGSYRVPGLEPGVPLAVRFRDPASGVIFGYPVNGETAPGSSGATCVSGTPPAGQASSCVGTGANPQLTVVLVPGAELPQQSLPIDPSGVIYDAVLRSPVAGSVVTLAPAGVCTGWNPGSSVVAATLGGYTVAGNTISMTVGPEGFYQFLLAPAAPASCNFSLAVTPPSGYSFASTLIPPTAGPLAPAGGPGTVFAVQPQAGPPAGAPGPATTYYLLLTAGSAAASIVHNHIPLDPSAIGALSLSKTGDRSVAEIGDSVRYTLTLTQANGGRPAQTSLVDRLPAGFTYIPGTASVNGVPIADPAGGLGPNLVFKLGPMPTSNQLVLRYRARVGVGAQQGDGVNRAQAHACQVINGCVDAALTPLASAVSTNRAEFRVRVVGGVFTTDACVLGKVFIDCNNNHVQDREELGVPGVRLMLSDGTTLISDSEGKYSMCGLPPRSHVLRVDPTTLPRGSRLTTSSNRNLGDAGSLWLDLKNGELHRADFIEGSCSNTVLEQTKARRAQGEVRSVESEKKGAPALRFDSKAHELDTLRSPQQGTDGANQQAPKPRPLKPDAQTPAKDESNVPTPELPMNQPPPRGRTPGQPSNAANVGTSGTGGSNGSR